MPDAVCPFCGAAQPEEPSIKAMTSRVGTRAAMVFGATAVVAACGGEVSGLALPDDGGGPVPPYGAPGPDH